MLCLIESVPENFSEMFNAFLSSEDASFRVLRHFATFFTNIALSSQKGCGFGFPVFFDETGKKDLVFCLFGEEKLLGFFQILRRKRVSRKTSDALKCLYILKAFSGALLFAISALVLCLSSPTVHPEVTSD